MIDYPPAIKDLHENLEDYNLTKKRRVLIVFDDMIADMEFILYPIVTELFLRGRKLNILLVFISQSYLEGYKVKTIRLSAAHYFYHENS